MPEAIASVRVLHSSPTRGSEARSAPSSTSSDTATGLRRDRAHRTGPRHRRRLRRPRPRHFLGPAPARRPGSPARGPRGLPGRPRHPRLPVRRPAARRGGVRRGRGAPTSGHALRAAHRGRPPRTAAAQARRSSRRRAVRPHPGPGGRLAVHGSRTRAPAGLGRHPALPPPVRGEHLAQRPPRRPRGPPRGFTHARHRRQGARDPDRGGGAAPRGGSSDGAHARWRRATRS